MGANPAHSGWQGSKGDIWDHGDIAESPHLDWRGLQTALCFNNIFTFKSQRGTHRERERGRGPSSTRVESGWSSEHRNPSRLALWVAESLAPGGHPLLYQKAAFGHSHLFSFLRLLLAPSLWPDWRSQTLLFYWPSAVEFGHSRKYQPPHHPTLSLDVRDHTVACVWEKGSLCQFCRHLVIHGGVGNWRLHGTNLSFVSVFFFQESPCWIILRKYAVLFKIIPKLCFFQVERHF